MLSATGGSERHALVLDHGLRPLFAFFSADIIATGVYATEADFADYQPSQRAAAGAHRSRRRRTELAAQPPRVDAAARARRILAQIA